MEGNEEDYFDNLLKELEVQELVNRINEVAKRLEEDERVAIAIKGNLITMIPMKIDSQKEKE